MPSPINKKTLEHLAALARIELDPREEEKLLADLLKIIDHFKELQELNTSNVAPVAGGSSLKNIFREDDEPFDGLPAFARLRRAGRAGTNRGAGVEAFPERESGYLKIPPVF